MNITSSQLRQKYINFFVKHGHALIGGRSVVPENDPTVLFTTAGMHPLVPYLLGEPHGAGKRLVSVQKCIRTGDIDSVGDTSHLTFFEMLGNWSLGDYFKEEALTLSTSFIKDELGIPLSQLYVTIFAGEDGIPRDDEAEAIWLKLGVPAQNIYALGKADNWWGPAGSTGPCGPDSEMFLTTTIPACGPDCRPGCSCGHFIEIWNDVFMQYNKDENGGYSPLAKPNIDTGMGVERMVMLLNGYNSVYETELFTPILAKIEELSGQKYGGTNDNELGRAFRIIADHSRTITIMLADEVDIKPSNVGRGYILRRLIRRTVRMGRKLGIEGAFIAQLSDIVLNIFQDIYPEMLAKREVIQHELKIEEELFGKALLQGEKEFAKLLPNLLKNPNKILAGRVAFRLYDTFGFPLELTEELAAEHGLSVDVAGFNEAFAKHQESSKGEGGSFKGGLADNSEQTTKYHTATHLLNEALRRVLGNEVAQQGSNITAERLRFDFNFERALTNDEITAIEKIVNEQIAANHPVVMTIMSLEEAKKLGAQAQFNNYEEQVKVYKIGDFSLELCGGPHVEATGRLGVFKITKEQSSARGIRRIRAALE